MIYQLLPLLLLVLPVKSQSPDDFFRDGNSFFSTYVNQQGLVDYKSIKENPALLTSLVSRLQESNIPEGPSSLRTAYLINAYNVFVIDRVVRAYPLGSPLDQSGFFDERSHSLANKLYSLNQIEKQLLFGDTSDERLHFVLVCAAKSCPPLATFAYMPSNLEKQLEERTKYTINLSWFTLPDEKRVRVSKIFEWYRADFASKGGVKTYIDGYHRENLSKKSLRYYDYDWSLNSQ